MTYFFPKLSELLLAPNTVLYIARTSLLVIYYDKLLFSVTAPPLLHAVQFRLGIWNFGFRPNPALWPPPLRLIQLQQILTHRSRASWVQFLLPRDCLCVER
jgi:hypothetical protein